MTSLGMLESISQSLPRDTVDLISNHRLHLPRRTFHPQAKCCRTLRGQLVPQRLDRFWEIARGDCRRAQVVQCTSALCDRAIRMSEAFFEFGFCPSVRKQFVYN